MVDCNKAYEIQDFMRRYGVEDGAIGIIEEHWELIVEAVKRIEEIVPEDEVC